MSDDDIPRSLVGSAIRLPGRAHNAILAVLGQGGAKARDEPASEPQVPSVFGQCNELGLLVVPPSIERSKGQENEREQEGAGRAGVSSGQPAPGPLVMS